MTWKQSFRLYVRTLAYFREGMPRLVLQIVLMGLGVFFGVISAFPLMILMDGVFHNIKTGSWASRLFYAVAPESIPAQIVLLAIITLVLRLAREVLSMVQTMVGIKIGYQGLVKVRCDLFRKLQELSLSYHKSQPQGDAIYRLGSDVYGFQTVLNLAVQTILFSALTLLMMIGVMFSFNGVLTLIALAVVPGLLWASVHYGKIFREKSLDARQADSEMTTAIQRSVSTIELVQAFGREADEFQHFQGTVGNSVKIWLKLHWQEVCYWLVVGTIFGVGGALIFGYGGWLAWQDEIVRHDKYGFTIGKLVIFMTYLGQLYDPLNKLSNSSSSMQGGVAGVQRVFEVLDRESAIADAPGARPLALQERVLEFDHVSFAYRPGELVLKDVSVKIAPGQMVAFVGSSGVGKTTLLNLLPRFYDPTEGALKLDEYDLRSIKLQDLRKHVALVLQDSAVLPATVAENIAYGRPSATPAEIARAAEMAGAAEFIQKMPDGFNTILGERGSNLSGGQRQRIGIARALLTNSPILVLDEPTSALDGAHEAMIVRTLSALKGKRTIILVSHRLSTVFECDQIFVMHNGSVVEKGTHEELIATGGRYFEIARHQLNLEQEIRTPG